jgi:hypothetical protein
MSDKITMNLNWTVEQRWDDSLTFVFFNLQRSQALLVLLRTPSPELAEVPTVDDMWRGFMVQGVRNNCT